MHPKQSYVPTLDGWRGVAIALVVGAHSVPMLENSQTAIGGLLARAFRHAGYGVDVFFCLSGFLICTLLLKERAANGGIGLGAFYVRRGFRILPPILAYLLALLALRQAAALPNIADSELLGALFFARNYVDGSWYTGHFWSLAVEEHFYFVAPWLLLIRSPRKLMVVLLSCIALCISIRWIEFSRGMFSGTNLQFRSENRIDALAWGAVLALVLHMPKSAAVAARWLKLRYVAPAFLVTFVLLLSTGSSPVRRTLVAATLPLLIGYTVLNVGSPIGRLLENRALRWLGRLSYSVYIWQMLFLVPGVRHMPALQGAPLAFVGVLACALASFYLVEKPLIRLGHRFSARIQAGTGTASKSAPIRSLAPSTQEVRPLP